MNINRLLISVRELSLSLLLFASTAFSSPADEVLKGYASEAKKADPTFTEFDAEKGKTFYYAENKLSDGKTSSCAECHTKDPTKLGKARTGKAIEPMAPAVNNKRFTDQAKVEKWFKRNCNDVYERPCTAMEKGNFIKFMQSLK